MEMIQFKGWEMGPLVLEKGSRRKKLSANREIFCLCLFFQTPSVPRQEAYLGFKENESM